MKQLFPVGIMENTVQIHWTKRHSKSKIIYFIIIVSLIAVLVSLPFVYVDVSTQSRGIIRTPEENNSIQSAIYAEVIQTIIYENKQVAKGDTLIWLRTDELDEQINRLLEKQIENSLFIHDIDRLVNGSFSAVTPKYQTEVAQYRAKLAEQDIALSQVQNEYVISKELYEKGVEAKYDYQQTESRYKTAESQKALVKQQQINSWQAEKTRLEYENKDLNSQLLQLQKRKTQYVITAPVSGTVVQYNGIQAGNFQPSGQVIAKITTADSLMTECYISPVDIGYISKGQKVQIQADAYNYQQWGLLSGEVTEVLPDIVEMNNQPYFRVRCAINRNYLELPNGYKGYMKKGMNVTGRFYLTRRSLAQLLFDEIDNWMNPKIKNDGNKD
ncbi:HlyD family secretion protein [Dysgonomonas termitidis]|uniref:HlyD family secretion protein n=1 Tax=Dysgonomonas termitidis TaxID=1516126 RepID=A0ABV9L1W0_9BACT